MKFLDSYSCENIAQATLNDLDIILKNETASYECPWSKSMLEQSLHDQIDIESFQNDEAITLVFVLTHKSKIIGHLIVQKILDELHLHNICVVPKFQNNQFGKKWMLFLRKLAIFLKVNKIFLEVRASNSKAINLYKKSQFLEIGNRKKYYKTNTPELREDALIFQWCKH